MNANNFIKLVILAFLVVGAISVFMSIVSAEHANTDLNVHEKSSTGYFDDLKDWFTRKDKIYPDNTYYRDFYEEEVLNSKNKDICCLQSDINNETPIIQPKPSYIHTIVKNGVVKGWIMNETPNSTVITISAVPTSNVPFYDPATAEVPYVAEDELKSLENPLPDEDIELMRQRGLFQSNKTINT